LTYPEQSEEVEILNRNHTQDLGSIQQTLTVDDIVKAQNIVKRIFVDESIKKYISDIIFATRFPEKFGLKKLENYIAFGASPRGSINLMKAAQAVAFLEGRAYVIPEDIKTIALDVLRHRVIPHYEAQAEGITSEHLIKDIVDHIAVP
jgi:MoxR-like ATPase